MIPLLERQPYITRAVWAAEPEGLNLDVWRAHWRRGMNLTDIACRYFRVEKPGRNQPWLEADPVRVAPVIFHRSPRYHNDRFPWRAAWEKYHTRAVFVGLPEEHAAFESAVGRVAYHPTADMLELANVIKGADLYVGNQSSPAVVAEGLKVRMILEACVWADNWRWCRTGRIHGWGPKTILPELD